MRLVTHFVNMILDQFLTYNLLMTSAAAHVCMYVNTTFTWKKLN